MGTWSQPNTEEKAKQLASLMDKPILKKDACDRLYDLVGDDELFDFIDSCECREDVRVLVKLHLQETLKELHLSRLTWDAKAIEICQRLAD